MVGPGYKESFAVHFAKDSDKVDGIITKIAESVKKTPKMQGESALTTPQVPSWYYLCQE
jgi:hypothetical protein